MMSRSRPGRAAMRASIRSAASWRSCLRPASSAAPTRGEKSILTLLPDRNVTRRTHPCSVAALIAGLCSNCCCTWVGGGRLSAECSSHAPAPTTATTAMIHPHFTLLRRATSLGSSVLEAAISFMARWLNPRPRSGAASSCRSSFDIPFSWLSAAAMLRPSCTYPASTQERPKPAPLQGPGTGGQGPAAVAALTLHASRSHTPRPFRAPNPFPPWLPSAYSPSGSAPGRT
jgi:hypothetical protein